MKCVDCVVRILLLAFFLSVGVSCVPDAARAQQGITAETITPEVMARRGLFAPFGVLVTAVAPGSAAAAAGIQVGDVVVSVGTARVNSPEELAAALGSVKPGDKADVAVLAQGKTAQKLVLAVPAPVVVAAGPPPQGEPVLMLDTGGHMGIIKGLAFTADGQHIVSAGDDKVVRVWEWATGRTVATLRGEVAPGHEGKIFAMALSPGARWGPDGGQGWLAVGGWLNTQRINDEHIRLYDLASGRLVRLLRGHGNVVLGLAFAPGVGGSQGQPPRLISGSGDRTAIVWDTAAGPEANPLLHRLQGHAQSIYAVGFSPDGRRAVTGSDDGTLKLWDVATGKLITTMTGNGAQVGALAVSPRDGTIASGDDSGEIRLWDGGSGKLAKVLGKQSSGIGALALSFDGSRLVSTCSNGPPCGGQPQIVWDTATGRRLLEPKHHGNIVLVAAISPDSRLVATGGGSRFPIHVWDIATAELRRGPDGKPLELAGQGDAVWAVAFAVDGRSIAWGRDWTQHDPAGGYGALEFQLRLPSANARLGTPQPLAPEEAIRTEAWLRANSSQGGLRLVHRPSQGVYARPEGILDISRDGRTVASIERGPADGLRHRAYTLSPDGLTIASGGANGVLSAYNLDGKSLGNFVGHEGDVWAVAPSPDGRYLISGSADQTVRLWNLATRQLIVTLFHGSDGEWVMWTPQGYYTGSERAGDIVGWQQNYGPENAARYVTAGRLRHMLRRPDIVERAIVLADAAAAVKELASTGPTLAQLVRSPPPEIWLKGDPTTATGRARLVLEVERTGRPVTAFDVHLGAYDNTGLFVAERRLAHRPVPVPAGYTPQFPERELRAFEVDLREGANLLAVVARTDIGETTSVPTQVVSRADALGEQGGALRVLAIGIDKYPDASPYPGNLAFAGKDARDFADTARRTIGLQHASVDVDLLCNGCPTEPTKANIEAALQRMTRADPKDTVVLFIAGHGEGRRGQYVLLPTDHRRSRADEAGETVVEWKTIRDALANAPGRKIAFLDTCNAANATNDSLQGDARGFKFAAFTAAQAGAIAEADDKLQQGRFTHALRLGLGGEAKASGPIWVYDLGSYLSTKVRELSRGAQEAEFFSGAGNFVLVRR